MTLTEFLLARIAEDEETAQAATVDDPYWLEHIYDNPHIVAWSPDRVLDECEAKRRIVEELCYVGGPGEPEWVPYDLDSQSILQLLAAPYANHPDFDEDWRT
jgi:hypothetical protein